MFVYPPTFNHHINCSNLPCLLQNISYYQIRFKSANFRIVSEERLLISHTLQTRSISWLNHIHHRSFEGGCQNWPSTLGFIYRNAWLKNDNVKKVFAIFPNHKKGLEKKEYCFADCNVKSEINKRWQRFSGFRASQMMSVCLTDTAESFPLSAFTVLCLCFVRSEQSTLCTACCTENSNKDATQLLATCFSKSSPKPFWKLRGPKRQGSSRALNFFK